MTIIDTYMSSICERLHLFLEGIFEYYNCELLKKSKKVTPEYHFEEGMPLPPEETNAYGMRDGYVIVSIVDVDIEKKWLNGYANGGAKRRSMG